MSSIWLLASLFVVSLIAILCLISPLKTSMVKGFCLGLVLLGGLAGFYLYWGGFVAYDAHQQQEYKKQQVQKLLKKIKSPQALIEQLSKKLDETPQSAKGWYLLGRLYLNQKDQQKALASFAKAHQLSPDNEQYTVNYAFILWEMNNQQFTPQLINLFTELLQHNPEQPDALAMLAMHAFSDHAYEAAIDYWQRLLRLMPPQSKEALAIQKAIAKAQAKLKKKEQKVIKNTR